MTVEIIGAESLGVRSLCCVVQAGTRRIVIDPGVALGYCRHGLLPHPCELALAGRVRNRIIATLECATDVVFSHMHGDHVPLRHARPYQLSFQQLPQAFFQLTCWSKGRDGLSRRMQRRFSDLAERLSPQLCVAEGLQAEPLSFSPALPHGDPSKGLGSLIMTRVNLGEAVFVHASDTQLLEQAAIEQILSWQSQIVLAAGPPLYLSAQGVLTQAQCQQSWNNALRLAQQVETLILDHHLLRSREGFEWLNALSEAAGKRIYCAVLSTYPECWPKARTDWQIPASQIGWGAFRSPRGAARHLLPDRKRLTTSQAIVGGRRVMMANPKEIANGRVGRQEALGLPR